MKFAIASDHAGFKLKEQVKDLLTNSFGCQVEDFGPSSDDSVDYPDYAHKLASTLEDGDLEKGILICGSGIGMAMAANRHKGVRAAVLRDVSDALMSRKHNDCNVACLGERFTSFEEAESILKVWFETPFEGGRHSRRVDKIETS